MSRLRAVSRLLQNRWNELSFGAEAVGHKYRGRQTLKPVYMGNFYMTNIFDSVDGTANNCQQFKV